MIDWLIEVGTHSPALAKNASVAFLSLSNTLLPLRVIRPAVSNSFPQICSFLLSTIPHHPDSIEVIIQLSTTINYIYTS